jgi:hypothetical protein
MGSRGRSSSRMGRRSGSVAVKRVREAIGGL